MAVGYDTIATGSTDAASTTVSITVASNSNRILLAMIAIGNSTGSYQVSSVAFNGTALSRRAWIDDGADNAVEIWYLLAPDTGTHDLVVNYVGTPDAGVAAVSLYNVDQNTPASAATEQNSGTDITLNITTSTDNSMVVDVTSVDGTGGGPIHTPDAGQTERADYVAGAGAGDFNSAVSTRQTTTAGTYNMGWTITSSRNYCSACVELVESITASTFTIDGIVAANNTDTFTIDGYVAVRTTDTFTIDGIVIEQPTDTFTIDGLISATNDKTFTLDGIITSGTTSSFTIDGVVEVRRYVLGDIILPRPNRMHREAVRNFTQLNNLSGRDTRDYTNTKEKIYLQFDFMTADKMADLQSEIDKEAPVTFSIFEDDLEIDQVSVLPYISRRDYVKGGSYYQTVQLHLLEVS